MRDGMLTFCRSSRLGALLPYGPSRSRRSALESSRSSAILLLAFQCSCSSKPDSAWWGTRRPQSGPTLTSLEQSVAAHLPEHCWWLPLIEWVPCNSFVGGALAVAYDTTRDCFPHRQRQLMMLENQQWATWQTHDHNNTYTTQKREDLTESTGVMPAEYPPKVKLELLTTLEC